MNPHTIRVLEYDKILKQLAAFCAFGGGAELASSLLPSDDLRTINDWMEQTSEASRLLDQKTDVYFGGVYDLRALVARSERGSILIPTELVEVRTTLMRARTLRNTLTRLNRQFPRLADIAFSIEPCEHVIGEISRCINDRAEVVDSASADLGRIRAQLRVAQDRLLSTLDRLVQNTEIIPFLQESIVTQRQGRYVIPVRSEYKGQVQGIVHDQSASGATFFIEPLTVVEQNNAVRELELEEEKEVRRILTELSDLVADEGPYISRNVQILSQLDFTFAKAKYALEMEATAPEIVPFQQKRTEIFAGIDEDTKEERTIQHPGSVLNFRQARHPLLDPESVVPIDVYFDNECYILVVTGPNTGGKTVTLKTVGLLTLMAQSGMMIPVEEGSSLSVFEGVYADIGDEQSIEQNLSTFSSHMTNIISILEEADPQSLVLLDELGAGTDPDEGSALAAALLENLRDRGITTLATTHYSDLKLYAHNTAGVRNASVEFDVEKLSPTFELSIGLPGRSNALTIARRLGLNPVIVDDAEKMSRPESLEVEAMLEDVRHARQEAKRVLDHAKERESRAHVAEEDLRYQLARIEEARRQVVAETRTTMQNELAEIRREIDSYRRRMAKGGTGSQDAHTLFLQDASQTVGRRQLDTEGRVEQEVATPGAPDLRIGGPIEKGDRVFVPNLQATGEVIAVEKRGGAPHEADVQVGNFRLRLPIRRLELRSKAQSEASTDRQPAVSVLTKTKTGGASSDSLTEIDLRGERVDAGLQRLEGYLDDAYLENLPWVRIIHGKGTGAMRDAVRAALKGHPLVSRYRPGEIGEGDDGVTVANLMTDEG
ncbi:MAG: endonuclease MutS2 [Caldilineaceae bacterium SB0670_bin_27]|uniref:Endonuclease MutS2 n=1 Tax=Caldilineaceae bacterium SB0664_bin_27 TaxID=2605260 RepID=A0A6B0YT60_9CHLR|nr:endonuclease MutS2 [Caldilineaceae bacterium SB0664_bin_27]MYJ80055.1 endonuclease MutS2 [Caldilineaceae bacterium SB0670_bin_27]